MYEVEDSYHEFDKWIYCYNQEKKNIIESMENMWYTLIHENPVHWLMQIKKGRDYERFLHFRQNDVHDAITYSCLMDMGLLAYNIPKYGKKRS